MVSEQMVCTVLMMLFLLFAVTMEGIMPASLETSV